VIRNVARKVPRCWALGKVLESGYCVPITGIIRHFRNIIVQIDKFTSKLQEALVDAQSIAVGNDNHLLAPAHLTQALQCRQGGA
ncbi:uncharacterized protein METZ01_LOCUS289768, partial [marine metagenome]